MTPRMFISCSFDPQDQQDYVEPILDLVRACDIEPVVLNAEPRPGELHDAVKQAIEDSPLFLAIVTPNRDGNKGTRNWIAAEVTVATHAGKEPIVFRHREVDPDDLPFVSQLIHVEFDGRPTFSTASVMVKRLKQAAQDRAEGNQIGRDITVTRRGKSPITVARLNPTAAPHMSASTFFRGMEFLIGQIQEHDNRVDPDLIVGINHGGLMAASFIEARLRGRSPHPLCVIKTGPRTKRPDRKIYYHNLPKKKATEDIDTVLVFDSTIKGGSTSQQIIQELQDNHLSNDVLVYFAALVACGVRIDDAEREVTMESLFESPMNTSKPTPQSKHPPDFLAFVSHRTVRAPHGIP